MHLAVQFYRSLILKPINIHIDNFISRNKIFLEILSSLEKKQQPITLNGDSYDKKEVITHDRKQVTALHIMAFNLHSAME